MTELQRMTEEYGLSGVTSNPSIFEKAIRISRERLVVRRDGDRLEPIASV